MILSVMLYGQVSHEANTYPSDGLRHVYIFSPSVEGDLSSNEGCRITQFVTRNQDKTNSKPI